LFRVSKGLRTTPGGRPGGYENIVNRVGLEKLVGPVVVDGGGPVIRVMMMVAEGVLGLVASVVVVVVVVVVPVAVKTDARIGGVNDVVGVGVETEKAEGRFMMLAEVVEGSRDGSARILRGSRGVTTGA
jgi:hypothetical protein